VYGYSNRVLNYRVWLPIFATKKKSERMHEIKPWKVTSSTYIHQKPPFFVIRKDAVQLPNGSQIDPYYTFEYTYWVNVIAITREGKYILEKQYRHGLGQIHYEICGGVGEAHETDPLATAQRELLEETGYGKGTWTHLMSVSANPASHNNLIHCYLATDVEYVTLPQWDETEDIGVELVTFEQFKEIVSSGQMVQSLMLAPIWKHLHDLK
jgi:ADP-ribose pyrophosphatase